MTQPLEELKPIEPLEEPDLAGCEMVTSLVDWLDKAESEAKDGECIPCGSFAVITPWYVELLNEQGYTEQAQRIEAMMPEGENDPDLRELAKALDEIRDGIDNERVKGTLTLYDCMLQTHGVADETAALEAQEGEADGSDHEV